MRVAVRRLHAAGIEVILDVVYNHTAEGSELGPTLAFRGLDNASYYRLLPDNPRHCINDTGTGNTLNLSHPRVLQMVMDSLRYWVTSYHVDGFRFDLGVTLGREGNGFDPGAGFLDAVRQDPVLSRVKLIAEPWDLGPGGYQLGQLPPGFSEWNDKFRDGVRRFWRGDEGHRAILADCVAGSSPIFERRGRRPYASINYVASHDGFTLLDTVSYAERHNEANGEDNKDGHSENFSANWGVEGPTEDPWVLELRGRLQRAMLATVLLSQGTPMVLAGDELGRTQNGNNNAYCQDDETSWIDWSSAASPDGRTLSAFTARLIALRRRHSVLRCSHYLHGREEIVPGIRDIDWFDEMGDPLTPEAWKNPLAHLLTVRRAGRESDGSAAILTCFFNADSEDHDFRIPGPLPARLLIDSAAPHDPERDLTDDKVSVRARSVLLVRSVVAAEGG